MTSPGEEVTVITSLYLSAGAPAPGEAKGLILEDNKYKDFLSNFIKNNYSVYPKIYGTKNGETKLEDIFNYLVSKKYYLT